MTTERFTDQNLTLEVSDDGPDLEVTWRGRSTAREPGKFLRPIFTALLDRSCSQKRGLVLDFRPVEYFNSSTLTPVIRLLEQARQRDVQLVVRYRLDLNWQEISFSAMRAFVGVDERIRIEGG